METLQTQFVDDCIAFALVALPLYEYLITLDEEVDLVWKRKRRFSLPSILLISTRTGMVLSAITAVIAQPSTCKGLKVSFTLQDITSTVGFIQVALFSALRVSALYNRNLALFILVLIPGLVPVGTNIFGAARAAYIQEPGLCIHDISISDNLTHKLVLVSRISTIVSDVLVVILTWIKTSQQALHSRLLACLTRDGTLYFLALLAMNIVQILMYRTHLGTPVASVLPTLPPILISRFMLNLRRTGDPSDVTDALNPRDRSLISTLGFQLSEQTVGSMGEPLTPLDSEDAMVCLGCEDEMF